MRALDRLVTVCEAVARDNVIRASSKPRGSNHYERPIERHRRARAAGGGGPCILLTSSGLPARSNASRL